ncbi:MAG TPA: hypothetical protein PKE47_01255 [Verrucomicrobiota bacterium]|nr:hypothetical protein [Verrucomicrobiota bacterium]
MRIHPFFWLAALVLALTACGGKEDSAEAMADYAPAAEETAEVAEAEAPAPDFAPAAEVSPEQVNAAMQQRDYVRAADLLIQQSLTRQPGQEDDSMVRMRELQMQLADAVAAGDPKAKQAAELLRRLGRPPR